jgi:hypothetical protein
MMQLSANKDGGTLSQILGFNYKKVTILFDDGHYLTITDALNPMDSASLEYGYRDDERIDKAVPIKKIDLKELG